MKKLILALLFLLLSCPVFAENQQLAWMGPVMVGSGNGIATGTWYIAPTSHGDTLTNNSSSSALGTAVSIPAGEITAIAYKLQNVGGRDGIRLT